MVDARVASVLQVFVKEGSQLTRGESGLEDSFFKSLSLPNGTHKTTARARLTDVDQLTGELVSDRGAVRLLDVGISSGVTTLELIDRLESQGLRVGGVGIDICVRAFLC